MGADTVTRSGQVAVVTGAGSGLGRCIAHTMLGGGYRVVLLGRRRSMLEETVASAPAGASGALTIPADISDEEQVAAAFRVASEDCGSVDLLVNNAGSFGPRGAIDEVDPAAWRRTVDVNLTGAFLCAREAVKLMKSQDPMGGRIINNGSVSAHTPRPGSVAYTATKHALTGLTKSISLDGRPYGIACGQIDVGNAATDMTAEISTAAVQADGSLRAEPTFDPQHVADAVLQMARLPLDVNIQFMTIVATAMPYLGRG